MKPHTFTLFTLYSNIPNFLTATWYLINFSRKGIIHISRTILGADIKWMNHSIASRREKIKLLAAELENPFGNFKYCEQKNTGQ